MASENTYTYFGSEKVVYSHYRDVTDPEHPVTLTAEPGKTYVIEQADSPRVVQKDGQFTDQELPMPPDDNWRDAGEKAFDPAEHDVPAVLAYLDDADGAEATRVLDAEAAGKNRKRVVDERGAILETKKD